MNRIFTHAFPEALGATVVIALLLAGIAIWSWSAHQSKVLHKERFLAVWRPLFAQYIKGARPGTPTIDMSDVQTFCGLWNFWHTSLRGGALDGLREIGKSAGLDKLVLGMLHSSNLSDRLLATVVLGNLQEPRAWEDLKSLLVSPEPLLSFSAAASLMQINADEAIEIVLPLCGSRADWPLARVAAIMQSAGPGVVSKPLAEYCKNSTPPEQLRFVQLLSCAQRSIAETTVRSILATTIDGELIACCLRQLKDKSDHDLICTYWDHPEWFVRLQAVKALGRVSTGEDTPLFIRRLKDEVWWVRYRAAEALAAIPSFDLYKWEQIAGKFVEPDLRRVLMQVTDTRRSRQGTGTVN